MVKLQPVTAPASESIGQKGKTLVLILCLTAGMAAPSNGSKESFQVYFNIIEARNIRGVEKDGKSDPFVVASRRFPLDGKKVDFLKTHHITLTSHPQWWCDITIEMGDTPSDIVFKMYDWNKVLKSKKIGEAILHFSTITAAGSYHKLDMGSGNGTLLVFAKLFTSNGHRELYLQEGPTTRLLFDSVHRQTVHPGELMRIGYVMRIKKPVELNSIVFDFTQKHHHFKRHLIGTAATGVNMRTWHMYISAFKPSVYISKDETSASNPINSKHRPYGESLNSLPKVLCAGIHYFHLEFMFPSQDSCGRFIGSGSTEDVDAMMNCGVDLTDANVETLGPTGSVYNRKMTPFFMKSDFYLHLKPTLPPMFANGTVDEDALFLDKVEIKWAVPEQGRNRISPLPPHLYNPEVISEEDRKRWFLSPEDDIMDAQGQERLYANLFWNREVGTEVSRQQSQHYLVLSAVTIDDTNAVASTIEKNLQLEYSVRLVCDRFAVSIYNPQASVRNQLIFKLNPTKQNVGRGKREYEVVKGNGWPHLIYTVPEEMAGHLHTSYVYIEVIATNKQRPSQVWVLQRRPFFVEASANTGAPRSPLKPVEPGVATGLFRVSYTHYPFIERTPDVVGDFGEPVTAFGPDRLVHLMAPATGPNGALISPINCSMHQHGSFNFTDALATPQEADHFEFQNIGSPEYMQDKSMNEPGVPLPIKLGATHTKQ